MTLWMALEQVSLSTQMQADVGSLYWCHECLHLEALLSSSAYMSVTISHCLAWSSSIPLA